MGFLYNLIPPFDQLIILLYLLCLSVCLYSVNNETAQLIGPKFCVGHRMTTGEVYGRYKFKKLASYKLRFSLSLKNPGFYYIVLQCILRTWSQLK